MRMALSICGLAVVTVLPLNAGEPRGRAVTPPQSTAARGARTAAAHNVVLRRAETVQPRGKRIREQRQA